MKIPFNKPFLGKGELSDIARVFATGRIGGNGPVCKRTEELLRRSFNIKFALLTTSCTHALESAMLALGIKTQDEVILPSFSFVSAANAVVRSGAKPVFSDIEVAYLNLDPKLIESRINKKTKAIICVHYAGFPCQMKEIMQIAKKHGLFVIEDAAQGMYSRYGERYLGTIGDFGCYSFHETKNFTCGEGGALLTNNQDLAKKVEIIREKGTNRKEFLLGRVDKYSWVDIGSSFVLSDILAAVILKQLQKRRVILRKRKVLGLRYVAGLKKLEEKGKIVLPKFSDEDSFNWHIFYFRVHKERERDLLLNKLRAKGIEAAFHFVPLHLSAYAMTKYGYKKGDFPITERVSNTLIRLPIYPGLTYLEQDYIIDSLYKSMD